MAFDLITVTVFGHPDSDFADRLRLAGMAEHEADDFDVHVFDADDTLDAVLAAVRPQVVLSFGPIERFPRLCAGPLEVRKRWLHFDVPPDANALAAAVLVCFIENATSDRFPDQPLVSVFTPSYKIAERITRAYHSLVAQSYTNWEWVVYDDSPDDATFEFLALLAKNDQRVRPFRADRTCGIIGEVKRRACGLARGQILVELDHDDELTDHCLADLVEAYLSFPDAGFYYTDCAEVGEDGTNLSYGDSYAFGFGSYRDELYRGRPYFVSNYPSVNPRTIRHIVGMPNHVRAWRVDAYLALGGYSSEVHVCDDYEILLRTFLTTRMVHIQRFGYIQYINTAAGSNTQRRRNREIQRLVGAFQRHYENQIHARFAALGIDDFMWRDGHLDWSAKDPPVVPIANYVMK